MYSSGLEFTGPMDLVLFSDERDCAERTELEKNKPSFCSRFFNSSHLSISFHHS